MVHFRVVSQKRTWQISLETNKSSSLIVAIPRINTYQNLKQTKYFNLNIARTFKNFRKLLNSLGGSKVIKLPQILSQHLLPYQLRELLKETLWITEAILSKTCTNKNRMHHSSDSIFDSWVIFPTYFSIEIMGPIFKKPLHEVEIFKSFLKMKHHSKFESNFLN